MFILTQDKKLLNVNQVKYFYLRHNEDYKNSDGTLDFFVVACLGNDIEFDILNYRENNTKKGYNKGKKILRRLVEKMGDNEDFDLVELLEKLNK